MQGHVYCIRTDDGVPYIGQAAWWRLRRRLGVYLRYAKTGKRAADLPNKQLADAVARGGITISHADAINAPRLEQACIVLFDTINHGHNKTTRTHPASGFDAEVRARMSDAAKARWSKHRDDMTAEEYAAREAVRKACARHHRKQKDKQRRAAARAAWLASPEYQRQQAAIRLNQTPIVRLIKHNNGVMHTFIRTVVDPAYRAKRNSSVGRPPRQRTPEEKRRESTRNKARYANDPQYRAAVLASSAARAAAIRADPVLHAEQNQKKRDAWHACMGGDDIFSANNRSKRNKRDRDRYANDPAYRAKRYTYQPTGRPRGRPRKQIVNGASFGDSPLR